jgi:RNA methyltransferase, TrmH family
MLSKPRISLIRSLSQLKFRRETGLFVAEGPKLLMELLGSPLQVEEVFALPSWINSNRSLSKRFNVTEITPQELDRISNLSTPNEVLALLRIPEPSPFEPTSAEGLVLALDAIRDPGNLGTIIRTADWFGITHILCSPDCVDPWNPKVIQASMGSIGRVTLHETILNELTNQFKPNFQLIGAGMHGLELYSQPLPQKMVLFVGSESHGLGKATSEMLDYQLTIPRSPGSQAESLNASVATAIICAEWHRQYKR